MSAARIDRVFGFEHGLPPVYGAITAIVGLAFLLLGWRLHRVTLVVTGFLIGAFVGSLIARWIQVDKAWGVFTGGTALALLAEPLSRLMVFLLAGLACGIALGEGLRLFVSAKIFLWGFFPGFVAGGLLSIWQLRFLIILSTSFLGTLTVAWGSAVFLSEWIKPPLTTFHIRHPLATLAILGLVFVIGMVVQFRFAPLTAKAKVD